jgi:hypothetical protein
LKTFFRAAVFRASLGRRGHGFRALNHPCGCSDHLAGCSALFGLSSRGGRQNDGQHAADRVRPARRSESWVLRRRRERGARPRPIATRRTRRTTLEGAPLVGSFERKVPSDRVKARRLGSRPRTRESCSEPCDRCDSRRSAAIGAFKLRSGAHQSRGERRRDAHSAGGDCRRVSTFWGSMGRRARVRLVFASPAATSSSSDAGDRRREREIERLRPAVNRYSRWFAGEPHAA